ncbi:aminotransferase class I/II-fold pyridoxal phosphate-dependent enzyme [Streptomyces sp. NPDC058697]|uniref:aminotransferase class I/II-fold pyridoxal phosphate-dependent enzyme n=2 Tax=unclassified Streptomyces TaxID=2593676 RepID=UPI0036551D6C
MNQDPNETHRQGNGPKTVTALLRHHLDHRPDALAYRFLAGTEQGRSGGDGESWDYRELDLRVRAVASLLQREGLSGKPVLLLHPPGLDYIAGFLGCLYAGAIAVPAYPPDTRRFGQTMPRLAAIARDSQATHALTTGALSRFAATKRREIDSLGLAGLRWLATADLGTAGADDWRDPDVDSDSTAFLQYTSGSTSSPKGVMVSNGNLLHNLRSIHRRLEHDTESGMVSWLPPYHDMGLIGGILTPLYGGFPAHLMSPVSFVRQPLLWLETLSQTRASTSVAPNFGFEHCVRRITDEQRSGLDLSHWRLALNGAEPVRADTLDRFAERFAPCGFVRRALLPCYGLAEATLMVTGVGAHEPPTVGTFVPAALGAGVARPASGPESERAIRTVGCGAAVDGVDVAIVDTDTRQRITAEERVGEIWVAGGSVAQGYWRRPEATEETFRARVEGEGETSYLRTGDLGFLSGGELHVVGRIKDVVIVQGRNHYPQDIELTVEQADEAIRPGSGAAFSIEVDGAEELVVAYEIEGRRVDGAPTLLAKLRTAIAEQHDVAPHAVVLLKRSTVHKTTSGKIQRQACKRAFLDLGLSVVAASVTRDVEVSPSVGRLAGLSAATHRQRVTDAVTEALTGVPAATTDAPDVTGWTFAELDLDYPALLTAVRGLEEKLGTRIAVGELLALPRVDALIDLFLGEAPQGGKVGSKREDASRSAELREPGAVEAWLVEEVARCLGVPAASVDVTRPLTSLGLDSKQAVAILAELGARTGHEVTTGTAFEHPTIQAVVAHLGASRTPADTPVAVSPPRHQEPLPEPIAIIGMGCRFPGAPDTDSYWRLLVDGRDAITEVPGDRWATGQVNAPAFGGFIDRVDEFDARFFGLSAREAVRMDPQQRLLLETAWQTVEDAGLDPTGLSGSATGVFVGISSHDYSELQMSRLETIDVHAATGNAHSIAANRLSYTLDLRGPSLALDAACSSSLLAVHLACESLRRGECDSALAGGVNLLITPGLSVAFAQGNMLSPDGRCRTFDDSANGYVRGEGVGLVLLKPLSAALADGDPIHAVIRGSATAHGGRSNGLTAPKGSAQRSVIERALAQAGLSGRAVDYVEAHGTGTSLGDPVEWEGLAAAYGNGRSTGDRCLVGSVKTNIGHLEAAAGIAGLIKAALVVRHRQVPPTLHLRTPNRRLVWEDAGLDVPTRLVELPDGRIVRAGVSSFGFGGSNAHLVLESAPEPDPIDAVAPKRPVHALCLSAHTATALTTLAQHWRTHLAAHPDAELADLCHTAHTGRAQLPFRAVVTGSSRAAFDTALDALARGGPSTTVVRGHARPGSAPKVAFLFSGQGTQYTGMGKGLYDTHTGFARTLDRADRVLRPHLGLPLTELLFGEGGTEKLANTRYSQAALVALEVALAELWISLGVRPAALLGHSIGAYGAACVAGVMSLEDALTLAVVRGRHMAEQPGDGTMIACAGDAEAIRAAVADNDSVVVAAVNAPEHLVLSGARTEIDRVRARLEDQSVVVRPLAVSHAFHSPLMAGAAQPLRAAALDVEFREPELPWVFDATGELVTGRIGADDWARHMLGPVRFADGFTTLRRLGCDAFVEIGPHPTLLNMARTMTTSEDEESVLWLPSLRRVRGGPAGDGDWQTLLQSLGRLHCAGGRVDWAALDEGSRRPRVPVPHAVLEGQRYWFSPPSETDTTGGRPDPEVEPTSRAPFPTSAAVRNDPPEPEPVRSAPTVADTVPDSVRSEVVRQVARTCAFPPEQIPVDARLGADLGFDSLMRTELERSLARQFPEHLEKYRESVPEDPTVGELVALLGTGGQQVPRSDDLPAAPRSLQPVASAGPVRSGDDSVPPVKQERVFEEWAEYAELQGRLRQVSASGSNPYGRVHEGFNSGRASVDGRQVINFSSFNYLALSNHPRVRRAAQEAIDRYGTSSSATPLLFGETPLHRELDAEIASFLGTEAAIVFAGGHATNVATIGHLFGPEDLVLHDEWIHDSALRGCMLSGARRRPFPHNDWRALDSMLGTLRPQARRVLVLIEGAYSQDGDVPDLRRFIDVKARHGAMLMIDEAHSIGVLGRTGRGIGEYFGVDRRDVDLWMGTLSKAIGSLGGYVAAREPIIEYLRFTAPLHIFSTGISPANTAAALEAIRVIRDEPQRVARVRQLSERFRDSARARGLDIGVSRASAVIPVVIGDWERTMALSNTLLDQGVNVMPIGYPAVPRDECRLRFFLNADHDEEDLEHALDLLGRAMSENTHTTPSPEPEPEPLRDVGAGADVLVTGASGFIGGHLTRRLAERGHRVRVLVREGSDRSAFEGVDVEVVIGELGDPASLRRATAGVRHVYNCAGMSADWGPWEEFRRINVDGSRNLVEAAHHAGTVERLLHLSTTDVYGYPVAPCDESAEPKDIGLPYNRSKVLGERAVRQAAERTGLPVTVVRPVSVYGPRSKDFVIEIATLLLSRQMVYIRGGAVPAGLIYVGNLVDGMIAACTSDAAVGKAYNMRDPDPTTWREYVEALARGLGVKPPAFSLPTPVARGVAAVSEKLYGALRVKSRPVLTRHAVHLFDRDQSYAIDRARDDFGFKSEVGFETGVELTLAWLDSPEGRKIVAR